MTLLRDFSYYQTGGNCRLFLAPATEQELISALKRIRGENLPFFVLGKGTNSLVSDDTWPGAVLSMHNLKGAHIRGETIVCEAGVENTSLSEMALNAGLGGLAWMNRLPGQIGATVRMNARCYGGEISQVVRKVEAFAKDGTVHIFDTSEHSDHVFRAYKDTLFMDNGMIVFRVTLGLHKEAPEKILQLMNFCEQDRLGKHQFDFPTCGCVFKNNYSQEVSVSSGLLLEMAGAKNLRLGGACVSPWHGNFIFNKNATSRDIISLSLLMREAVYDYFGVWLEYEMEILGEISRELHDKISEHRPPAYRTERLKAARQRFRETRPVGSDSR